MAEAEEARKQPDPPNNDKGKESRLKRVARSRTVQVGVALVLVVGALLFWWHGRLWEDTDDAQVDGHLNQISARVGGQVIRVYVEDNQFVKAGALLAEIDPTDYQVALARAEAARADAVAAAAGARVGVPITSVGTASQVAGARARVESARAGIIAATREHDAARARLQEAKAVDAKARSDLKRYTPLVAKDIISRQQYDQVNSAAQASAATVLAAQAAVRAASQEVIRSRALLAQMQAELASAGTGPQQVSISRSRAESARAGLKMADALLAQARLNLQYTKIVAPVDGITGKKSVEVGQNVQPGQVLLYLVPVEDIWITANFKENQLRLIRPGQRVVISVDAYDRDYDGYVESIGAASGARFSLFPPENATGNYVKVVQRIPVRIRLAKGADPHHLLRPGMSVVPKVRVR